MATITADVAPAPDLRALLAMDQFKLSPRARADAGRADRWMRRIGLALGPAVFASIAALPGATGLSTAGQLSAAAFALALVWWITEPIPTHVTSLVLMVLLVLTRAQDPTRVMSVLGLDVIWLNVLAFILSAMLVKTHLAKRLALTLIDRFGRRASWALGAFVVVQLVLAPLIPATAARAAITLPLMIAVAAIYGSTAAHPTNFGRGLFLVNLAGISILSSTVMTGSAANIMAVGFIQSLGGHRVYYSDWLVASAPVAILTIVAAWWLTPRAIFPLAAAERVPVVPGGLAAVAAERRAMGRMSPREWKAVAIFALVIFLWATDRFQQRWFGVEMGPSFAAMIGAVIALAPRIGLLDWDDTDIPWHLMIFSAGAYAGGLALENTGAAAWAVQKIFGGLSLERVSFGWTYAAVLAVMIYSHLLSTSKTVRTVIMIPAIIMLARGLGWQPASLALPAAFTIDWVVGLPISGKPNVILFGTNQYSVKDNLVFGLIVCTVGYGLLLLAGATWFHWLGLTPGFSAVAP
ncbi:MAG TPA: SLC13 family permease [Gemmatimonadaceae bacterium]|nr:SLC13 family permease [Gemmatimonadaceae bacterium]